MLEMYYLFTGILGWIIGMVVNYLSDVLPIKRKLTQPVCVYCTKEQPFIKYLLWPRRCQDCGKVRPLRTWLIEASYIAASIWLWVHPHEDLGYYLSLLLLAFFGVVLVIDMEHRLILHPVSWAGAVICFGLGWLMHGFKFTLIGGAAGYLLMLAMYFLGDIFARRLAKRRGNTLDEVALGFGDVNLSGVLGLLLGWPGITAGLILAIFIGGIVSMVYLVWMVIRRRYRAFTAIPYGPFLICSAVLLVFFNDFITGI